MMRNGTDFLSSYFHVALHLDALLTGQSGNISERSLQRHQQLELGVLLVPCQKAGVRSLIICADNPSKPRQKVSEVIVSNIFFDKKLEVCRRKRLRR